MLSYLTALLVVEAGDGVGEQRALAQRVGEAGNHLIKTPANIALMYSCIKLHNEFHKNTFLPFKIGEGVEGHHGAHPLTGRRQTALQEKLTALPTHRLKLIRAVRRHGQPARVCVCV